MKIFKLTFLMLSLLLSFYASSSYAEEFIKYKNYLIPVGNNCPDVPSNLERVFYMDDAGELPEDPNGIQEIPIVVGLHNYKVFLVAFGSQSRKNPGTVSYDLLAEILSRSQHDIPFIRKADIESEIIRQVRCLPSGEKLHVVMGGEYTELAAAITSDSSISNKIIAYGFESSNSEDQNGFGSFNTVVSALGSNLRLSDHYDSETNQPESSTQFFSNTDTRQFLHVMYRRGNITVSGMNNLFENHINNELAGIIDSNGIDISDTSLSVSNGGYPAKAKQDVRGQTRRPGETVGSDTFLRVADFLLVADVYLPLADVYDTNKMNALIIDATSRFD